MTMADAGPEKEEEEADPTPLVAGFSMPMAAAEFEVAHAEWAVEQ